MLNRTHLEHTVIAVLIQLALWPVFGLVTGGLTACAVFLGREIAQHEYKALQLQQYSSLNLGTLPWYVGLRYGWNRDSILDVLTPAVACGVVILLGRIWS